MGWRCKLIFLLIIYFAGFATAIYYLAPSDSRQCQAASYSGSSYNGAADSDKPQGNVSALFKRYYDKAAASFNNMDTTEFKAAFNRGMEKLKEMAKNAQNTQNTMAKGAEDK
jgi:hypothetical protein